MLRFWVKAQDLRYSQLKIYLYNIFLHYPHVVAQTLSHRNVGARTIMDLVKEFRVKFQLNVYRPSTELWPE